MASTPATRCPSCKRRRQRWKPMKPALPVTRIFIGPSRSPSRLHDLFVLDAVALAGVAAVDDQRQPGDEGGIVDLVMIGHDQAGMIAGQRLGRPGDGTPA